MDLSLPSWKNGTTAILLINKEEFIERKKDAMARIKNIQGKKESRVKSERKKKCQNNKDQGP